MVNIQLESTKVALMKRAILEFIVKYRAKNKVSPSQQEIAAEFDYPLGSLHTHYIKPLVSEGWVKSTPKRPRSLVPLRS